MGNDLKDTTVDWSNTSDIPPILTSTSNQPAESNPFITTCNESTDFIGHETFTLRKDN